MIDRYCNLRSSLFCVHSVRRIKYPKKHVFDKSHNLKYLKTIIMTNVKITNTKYPTSG